MRDWIRLHFPRYGAKRRSKLAPLPAGLRPVLRAGLGDYFIILNYYMISFILCQC